LVFRDKREKNDPDVVEYFGKANLSHPLLYPFPKMQILNIKTRILFVIFAAVKLVFTLDFW